MLQPIQITSEQENHGNVEPLKQENKCAINLVIKSVKSYVNSVVAATTYNVK